jgi:hypothetical protein
MLFRRFVPRSAQARYLTIAALSFTLGSATVVQAAGPVTAIFRLADGANPEQLAKVDAAGNVQVSVNNHPSTQQISGAVSVSNLPTTQDVNVIGGSLAVSSSLANKSQFFTLSALPGTGTGKSFPTINASLIIVDPRRSDVSFTFMNFTLPSGITTSFGFRSPPGPLVIPLNQRIPVTRVQIDCFNVIGDCEPTIAIVGD